MMTRRQALATCAASVASVCGVSRAAPGARAQLGVVLYVYSIRLAAERAAGSAGLADPIAFLEHSHQRGAGGIQTSLGVRGVDYLAAFRKRLEATGMYVEGIVSLPRDRADLDRFTAEAQTAKDAGARVLRTVLFSGRRYELFDSAAAYLQAKERALRSLALAQPVVARLDLRLAVENHKDLRTGELIEALDRLDSRHVGVCVDTGNNIALLEDPHEVVEKLAPRAFSVHLKDMAVAEYEDGFLLAEVPLGEGFLDLPRIVQTLRRAQPETHLNLEMITRDPLRVPCVTPKYWASAGDWSGRHLASSLTMVRRHRPAHPLLYVSALAPKQRLEVEDANARKSLAYAARHLGL
jgi:sugar phosphate isomerase/epimerase